MRALAGARWAAGSVPYTHGLHAAAEHPSTFPISRSKLDLSEHRTGKRWLSMWLGPAERGEQWDYRCLHARTVGRVRHRWTSAALPDQCTIAGAWPHLVALPETSLEGSLQALLSSPGAWPWDRRPSQGHVHRPQLGNAAKGCPKCELRARREFAGQEGARHQLRGVLERCLCSRGPRCPWGGGSVGQRRRLEVPSLGIPLPAKPPLPT